MNRLPARPFLKCWGMQESFFFICGKKPIKWSVWYETEYYVMHLFFLNDQYHTNLFIAGILLPRSQVSIFQDFVFF
jgi:hypothetical protein